MKLGIVLGSFMRPSPREAMAVNLASAGLGLAYA